MLKDAMDSEDIEYWINRVKNRFQKKSVKINGVECQASSIKVEGRTVYVDGKANKLPDGVTEVIIEGSVGKLEADGSVKVSGDVLKASAGGSITCRDIHGNASAGGSIKGAKCHGNLTAGGSIKING